MWGLIVLLQGGRIMISSSIYAITFVIILVAFLLIRRNFVDLRNHDEGTEDMQEIAGIIRDGAKTFLGCFIL